MNAPRIIIIGGGISGLTMAWWLKKKGYRVTVYEKSESVGGTMKSIVKEGWLVETGPNSALETTPLFKTLFADLGIENTLMYANSAGNNRYIVRNGKLHSLPMSPGKFLRTKLWSLKGKLRLLQEPLIGRAGKEETLAEFVERRLGKEFLDYAINPFVAGVFAGAPEKLSVQASFPKLYALEKNYGGLVKGMIMGSRERKKRGEVAKDRAQMFSFKKGMQELPKALERELGDAVVVSADVESITADRPGNKFSVRVSRNGESRIEEADAVVLAVPSESASRFIAPFDASLSDTLRAIYYPPVVELFLGYRSSDVRIALDGFGFLIPEKEKRKILGAIWTSTLFEGRAPEGCSAFTVFVGGSRQPEMTLHSDAELLDIVQGELASLMNITGVPLFTHIVRWNKAIPQYHLGHLAIVGRIEQFEKSQPGFFISGNFRGGISVSDCVIQSEKTANKISEICPM